MPLGFLTEDGPRPEFAELYGAVELPTADYPARTRRNVFESSATIWFGNLSSPGCATTERACLDWGRVMFKVREGHTRPSEVVCWLGMNSFRSLNMALG
jgi:Circularly permutated YpsA SLOG family